MASGTENVYGLGSEGVNTVDSPIHLKNGEVRQAQNAAFPTDKGQGGLGMRGGLARINASAMVGSVAGVINVPLPAPGTGFTRSFLLALGTAGANTWGASALGTVFVNGTSPARAAGLDKATGLSLYNQRVLSFNRKLYYPGDDYVLYPAANHTAPSLRVWDGVEDHEILRIPPNPAAGMTTNAYCFLDFVVHESRIYFSVWDPGGGAPDHAGRVFRFDPATGALEQIGNAFGDGAGENDGGMPFCLCSYNGYLYSGGYGIAGSSAGKLYRIRPGEDDTWTEVYEHLTGYIVSMAVYNGELYLGTHASAGTDALVLRMTNAATGAMATSDTGATSTGASYYETCSRSTATTIWGKPTSTATRRSTWRSARPRPRAPMGSCCGRRPAARGARW
jgi:outer membrane protein assembly factor BamB